MPVSIFYEDQPIPDQILQEVPADGIRTYDLKIVNETRADLINLQYTLNIPCQIKCPNSLASGATALIQITLSGIDILADMPTMPIKGHASYDMIYTF